ncbi:MAG TPA: ankyrin repeat domain-containing protein, partial [Pilimelia sp.]|nr:ankyrin repeat domain-containing protein [Pilimelia sp.]
RPLFYLAYSRADPYVPADSVLAAARLLLNAGADPNEAYPRAGQPYPLTVLTGVFGEAESGPERRPAHPHWSALARLLLSFGADHNDRQVLHNRMSRPDNDHLELLHEYGLATVYRSERDPVDPAALLSAELLREQLRYAVEHDFVDRVRLLVGCDVDYRSEYPDGHTPIELARMRGSDAVTDYLVSQRVAPPVSDPASHFTNAVLLNDPATIERLAAKYPDIVDRVGRNMPNPIAHVARFGPTELISLLVEVGFDVNATQFPADPGQMTFISAHVFPGTALHEAAGRGDLNVARVLLSLGADPDIRDTFDHTPLDHAREAGHRRMVALLAPITTEGDLAG